MGLRGVALLLACTIAASCDRGPCRSADKALVDRLHIRGPILGASVVEYSEEARYIAVSVDYNVGVWATNLDPAGGMSGVIIPANGRARQVSRVGLDTTLPTSHPVAVAAADADGVYNAAVCEAQRS